MFPLRDIGGLGRLKVEIEATLGPDSAQRGSGTHSSDRNLGRAWFPMQEGMSGRFLLFVLAGSVVVSLRMAPHLLVVGPDQGVWWGPYDQIEYASGFLRYETLDIREILPASVQATLRNHALRIDE